MTRLTAKERPREVAAGERSPITRVVGQFDREAMLAFVRALARDQARRDFEDERK